MKGFNCVNNIFTKVNQLQQQLELGSLNDLWPESVRWYWKKQTIHSISKYLRTTKAGLTMNVLQVWGSNVCQLKKELSLTILQTLHSTVYILQDFDRSLTSCRPIFEKKKNERFLTQSTQIFNGHSLHSHFESYCR